MTNQLNLEKRDLTGKKLKALRASGKIPSVIYGKAEPILAVSEYVATDKVLQSAGYHSPVELILDGNKQLAIIKNIALDPVSRRIINIEFQAVSADATVEATTPIKIINFETSEAAKKHYAILQVVEDVEIKAKPSELPSELTVDASKLATTEDKLTFKDIIVPKNVEFSNRELNLDSVIANVYDPSAKSVAEENETEGANDSTESSAENSDTSDKANAKAE